MARVSKWGAAARPKVQRETVPAVRFGVSLFFHAPGKPDEKAEETVARFVAEHAELIERHGAGVSDVMISTVPLLRVRGGK